MVLYGLNENLRSYKSLKKGANFRLSPALKGIQIAYAVSVCNPRLFPRRPKQHQEKSRKPKETIFTLHRIKFLRVVLENNSWPY